MGPQAVAAINRATDLFLDVHLMIYNPYDYIERFVEAGADNITFHLEATEDVEETLINIISAEGKLDRREAEDYLSRLEEEGRYAKDVY